LQYPTDQLLYRRVQYYDPTRERGPVDWAFAETIVMRKQEDFRAQQEYRFALVPKDLLRPEVGTKQSVQLGATAPEGESAGAKVMRFVQLGDIRSITKVHAFPPG